MIFVLLPSYRDVVQLSLVCKFFRTVVLSDSLWIVFGRLYSNPSRSLEEFKKGITLRYSWDTYKLVDEVEYSENGTKATKLNNLTDISCIMTVQPIGIKDYGSYEWMIRVEKFYSELRIGVSGLYKRKSRFTLYDPDLLILTDGKRTCNPPGIYSGKKLCDAPKFSSGMDVIVQLHLSASAQTITFIVKGKATTCNIPKRFVKMFPCVCLDATNDSVEISPVRRLSNLSKE